MSLQEGKRINLQLTKLFREALLSAEPVDITPTDKKLPWTKAANEEDFADEWSMKPVKVRGIFDHGKEVFVEKKNGGELGYDCVTPFYTHLNSKGEECGILVNRGWIPYDLFDGRYHKMGVTSGTIEGVLYRGDNKTKYTKPNALNLNKIYRVDPTELAPLLQMHNTEEASKFMLMQVAFDEDHPEIIPSAPTKAQLLNFRISPERHEAYANLWKAVTMFGIFANTALWVYF